ncbi:BTB/POZ domain-containing protein 19 isoform X4 [Lathamus discolor]|uniref:BTB/POZ domain-containing protein 19 isoform X4 n=1 Tax=Lathamus discolor TaxID=678569 RepID=UPI0032B7AFF1
MGHGVRRPPPCGLPGPARPPPASRLPAFLRPPPQGSPWLVPARRGCCRAKRPPSPLPSAPWSTTPSSVRVLQPPRSPGAASCPCLAPSVLSFDISSLPAALKAGGSAWHPCYLLPQRDVTFVVGREQQKVFAHRCVLACRCQAFRGMLSQGPAGSEDSPSSIPPQGPFILGNVQPEVFLAVIEFLYTNSVTLNSHIALEVLTSSVEYGLQDLCKLCIKFIKDTLNVEQVCEALQAAVTYGQTDLQQHCLAFIEGCTAVRLQAWGSMTWVP